MTLKISKAAQTIQNTTSLPKDCCRIIAEFARFQVHYRPGEYFLTMSKRAGATFMVSDVERFALPLGQNEFVHCYKVIRTTPCTIICDYMHSVILFCTMQCFFRYKYIYTELYGTRMFRPLDRIKEHEQIIIVSYIDLHDNELRNPFRYKYTNSFFIPWNTQIYPLIQ